MVEPQRSPVNPLGQAHISDPLINRIHVPPFKHVVFVHDPNSGVSQSSPVNSGTQKHPAPGTHVPPLAQLNDGRELVGHGTRVELQVGPLVLFGQMQALPTQVPLLRHGDDAQNKLGMVSLQRRPVLPSGQRHRAVPLIVVTQVAFGEHGILAHGLAISQKAPEKPGGHKHAYDVPVVRIQVPPFRQGGIVPGEFTHGSTISQKRPERPGGQTHKNEEFASKTHVPWMHVTVAHGLA